MFTLSEVQGRLKEASLYPGIVDGVMGKMTMAGLMMEAAAVRSPTPVMVAIAPALVAILKDASLTTPLRICHFLAQATAETANWATLVEYGGPTYCARYDPDTAVGKMLGNTEEGDGFAYRGRGPFQLTGRANYKTFGDRLGVDLVNRPDQLLTDMNLSARCAAAYWDARGCNQWADVDNIQRVTKLVNGGLNALAARTENLRRLKALWGLS